MFIGRQKELMRLEKAFSSSKSELVVIYGRRRIGKSSLISSFGKDKSEYYSFEAIEDGTTKDQILHFTETLRRQIKDPLLTSVSFESWENVFTFITERIIASRKTDKKVILFFDEIQWMAAGHGKLISIIKYFWDNHWKQKGVLLILCGSIASFVVKRVIKSKALYGRITCEILLKGLLPDESAQLFRGKRSLEEILNYLLVFGGVPKYLEEIDLNASFNQNMNALCFAKDAVLAKELDRVFYSQFRDPGIYKKISVLLNSKNQSLSEISRVLNISSGGGLKSYIENLENSEIIRSFVPYDRPINSKFKKYALYDEFLIFNFKFIDPNRRIIAESGSKHIFEMVTKDKLSIWLGFAFERFCIKNAAYIAGLLGFENEMMSAAPYFGKSDSKFQIDLLYVRSDKVITVCEIKHHNKEIDTQIIPEMERKCKLLVIPKHYSLEKALISTYGPDKALRNSGYFSHSITLEEIFGKAR